MPNAPDKVYLGDSVYAELDGDVIALTVEDGERVAERIVLESEVLLALDTFATAIRMAQHPAPNRPMAPRDERVTVILLHFYDAQIGHANTDAMAAEVVRLQDVTREQLQELVRLRAIEAAVRTIAAVAAVHAPPMGLSAKPSAP